MSFTAIDCQGLAGGIGLGFRQAGFEIIEKFEQPGGFGFEQYNENRHLLGEFPMHDTAAELWQPEHSADVVYGCPPCSGFSIMSVRAGSGLNRHDRRGVDAAINHCMEDFAQLVRVAQPTIAVMESVTNAGRDTPRGGYLLMRHIAEVAGPEYTAYHVFHDAYATGNVSHRKRFFLVLSKVPFGVHLMEPAELTVKDLLEDLLEAEYDHAFGHVTWDMVHEAAHTRRLYGAIEAGWHQGEQMVQAVERYYNACHTFPPGIDETSANSMLHRPAEKAADFNSGMSIEDYERKWNCPYPARPPVPFQGGAYEAKRWWWNRAGYVLAGNSAVNNVHPIKDRLFTYREIARIMGFPDDWNVQSYMATRNGYVPFGKAVTVDAARWIAASVYSALEGTPGDTCGEQNDDGVWVIK